MKLQICLHGETPWKVFRWGNRGHRWCLVVMWVDGVRLELINKLSFLQILQRIRSAKLGWISLMKRWIWKAYQSQPIPVLVGQLCFDFVSFLLKVHLVWCDNSPYTSWFELLNVTRLRDMHVYIFINLWSDSPLSVSEWLRVTIFVTLYVIIKWSQCQYFYTSPDILTLQ